MTTVNFVVPSSLKKGQERQIACTRGTAPATSIDGSVPGVMKISKDYSIGPLELERP